MKITDEVFHDLVMTRVVGGTWQVGTKNGDTVYIDRYSGPDATGDLIINANMDPDEARDHRSTTDRQSQLHRPERG
jgi:hypothetical protein